jgi:hypothetical protein
MAKCPPWTAVFVRFRWSFAEQNSEPRIGMDANSRRLTFRCKDDILTVVRLSSAGAKEGSMKNGTNTALDRNRPFHGTMKRAPFSVLRSPFSVLRSPFSVLRSPFSVNSPDTFFIL